MSPDDERILTPVGPARILSEGPSCESARRGLLVLGHGAGRGGATGGAAAPDLLAVRSAALALGFGVVRVEQPWFVAGRRVAEAPSRLDQAWLAVLAALRAVDGGGPLIVGGRSSGARVACRTAARVGATGVLALAFPLNPPGRPERSRLPELQAAGLPTLVVQGDRDRFGVPAPAPGTQVHVVRGADHGFSVRRRDGRTSAEVLEEVAGVVGRWLARLEPAGQMLT